MRKLFIALLILVFTAPFVFGAATVDGPASQNVNVEITIDGYIKILWNDTNIIFNNTYGSGGDWYSATGPMAAAYGTNVKASTDAYATDYYESYDFADLWFEANVDVDMTCSGPPVTNGTFTLPTWFTIAFCAGKPTYLAGFYEGGAYEQDGTIPLSGGKLGFYAGDAGSPAMDLDDGNNFYGVGSGQDVFAMDGTAWTGKIVGPANGSILFHARIYRNGLMDKGGFYSANLNVSFAESP